MFAKIKAFFAKFGMVILGAVILVAIACTLFFVIKYNADTKARQEQIQNSLVEMKTLSDGIVRAQAQYVTKDDLLGFAKSINLNLTEIQKDLNDLDADIIGISSILASSQGYHGDNLPSDHTSPNTDPPTIPPTCAEAGCDPYGYMANSQTKDIAEPFADNLSVPVGQATFSAWKQDPWGLTVLPRDYKLDTVLGQDKQGRHYIYHKFAIGVDGKEYQIPIKEAKFVEKLPEASFSWWNPRVGIGVLAGVSIPTNAAAMVDNGVNAGIAPSLQFSPFSYGKTEVKPRFIFPQIAIGYNVVRHTADFSISPFMYNLGDTSDVINNTYTGPTISVDTDANVTIGGSLSVTF